MYFGDCTLITFCKHTLNRRKGEERRRRRRRRRRKEGSKSRVKLMPRVVDSIMVW